MAFLHVGTKVAFLKKDLFSTIVYSTKSKIIFIKHESLQRIPPYPLPAP